MLMSLTITTTVAPISIQQSSTQTIIRRQAKVAKLQLTLKALEREYKAKTVHLETLKAKMPMYHYCMLWMYKVYKQQSSTDLVPVQFAGCSAYSDDVIANVEAKMLATKIVNDKTLTDSVIIDGVLE